MIVLLNDNVVNTKKTSITKDTRIVYTYMDGPTSNGFRYLVTLYLTQKIDKHWHEGYINRTV